MLAVAAPYKTGVVWECVKKMRFSQVIIGIVAAGGISLASYGVAGNPQRDDLSAKDLKRVRSVTATPTDFTKPQHFETMAGGAATTRKRVDANIFSHFSANLDFKDQNLFLLGNGLFRKDWVSSPSSTQASDGLGPLFNARSCQGCHIKDGRGHAPMNENDNAVTMLMRLSIPPQNAEQQKLLEEKRALSIPEPTYGGQLQDFAVPGIPAEARIKVTYEDVTVALNGGESITLRKPTFELVEPAYGVFHKDMMFSPRVAPPMIGLGMLEAIHESDILAKADPDDKDEDGISGKPNWVWDLEKSKIVLGRFGWKAGQPTLKQQDAHAFSGDMGLSTPLLPSHYGDCTVAQTDCLKMPHGAQPQYGATEVTPESADLVDFYASNLAVPARRNVGDKDVLAGKKLFHDAGCASCHTPSYVTAKDAPHPAQRFQLIWPYTDMLLHDMGEELADNRPEGDANGREWRTPPLWGIGLTKVVSEEATFLHDGRARTILEAVLWHGGEAQKARDTVVNMHPQERAQLLKFLESL